MTIADLLDPRTPTEKSLAKNLSRVLGEMNPSSLGTADVLMYRRVREGEGAANATVNRELRLLRAALNRAVDEGLVEPPARRIKWRILRESPRQRVLSREEVRALVGHLRGWHRSVTVLLLGTGARLGEILGVKRSAVVVDEAAGRVEIYLSRTKEGEGKVLVAVGAAAREAVSLYVRGYSRPFARREGSSPSADHLSLWRALQRASRRAGMEPVAPHDLRRTFASMALREGVPLEQVGQVLGHRSLETTRRYARIDAGTRIAVAGTVDRALSTS